MTGTEVSTGTTYFSVSPGVGSQSGVYYTRLDGAAGTHTTPVLIDNEVAALKRDFNRRPTRSTAPSRVNCD